MQLEVASSCSVHHLPCPNPINTGQGTTFSFFEIHFIINPPKVLFLFLLGFPTGILKARFFSTIRVACHATPSDPLICSPEYKSWSFSLCSFLQSPVTSTPLGPNYFISPGATQPIVGVYFTALYRALASSRTRLLDHTQRRATVGRTPLDEWSIRRRDLYLTTHNTHNRQTSMPQVGFEPTIAAGERS